MFFDEQIFYRMVKRSDGRNINSRVTKGSRGCERLQLQ